jgi:hypothetical protein
MPAPTPTLERPFAALSARVRRRDATRGAAFAVGAIIGLAAAAVFVDAALGLPQLMRCVLAILWLYYAVLLVNRYVLKPFRRDIPAATLAAAVESRYPAFSERLTTLTGEATGSPHLIEQLEREAERRGRVVEPERIPFGRSMGMAPVVIALLTLIAVVAVPVVPGAAGRVRRVVLPWYEPRETPAFRLTVTSGRPLVRRGDAVSLTALLERVKPGVPYPPSLDATIRSADGNEMTVPMAGDDRGGYALTRPNVRADFDYRLVTPYGSCDWLNVSAADAVSLTDASTVTVNPPDYAKAVTAPKTAPGFGPFEAMRFGSADLTFAFDRKPETASLEFGVGDGPATTIPVTAMPDGTVKATLSARESGTLTFTATGEKGLKSVAVTAVKVLPDLPPRFVTVVGLSLRAVEIRPGETLPLGVAVADDVAVAELAVEYRVANGPIRRVPLPATGLGTPLAEGRFSFDSTGKATAGETLLLRLRAGDNRNVPGEKAGPQESFFPPADWIALKITTSARPLAEQNVFGQRDAIADPLAAAARKLTEAKAEVLAASQSPPGQTRLNDEQLVRLKNARDRAAEATEMLAEAAREAGLIPDLAPVADAAKATAAGPVLAGAEATNRAERQPERAPRSAELDAAYGQFAEAIRQTEAAVAANERLAKDRLDRRTLDDLAADERALAVAANAAKTPAEAAALAARQKELRERLAAAVRDREGLRTAADAAAKRRAAALAKDAHSLRDEFDRLEADRRRAESDALAARNAGLAAAQSRLAQDAAAVAAAASAAAPASGTKPPDISPAATAAEKFQANNPLGAMADQESAARDLDRAAAELARAALARQDPKEAARQIARWQADLSDRYATATMGKTPGDLPAHVREAFAKEQSQVREAVSTLNVPPAQAKRKDEAVAQATEAGDRLRRNDPAGVALREATTATATLASQLPSRAERLKAARAEINKRIDEQANLTRDLRDAGKIADDAKRAALAARQGAIAQSLESLDVPGLEGRRDRAADAASAAARDVAAGRSHDHNASQSDVRRQLDRLKQAVDGYEPDDALANRLARKQKDIADAADKLDPHSGPAESDRVGELERELNRELANLSSPDSPNLVNAAKDAARAAEQATRTPPNQKPDVDELRKKTKAAADAMNTLANRLAGAESDAGRVERLLRERERAADEAKKLVGKPVNPDAHAEAVRKALADLDELDRTRVGENGRDKADALAALKRLALTPDPDRQPDLQTKAAEALDKLHAAVKADPDRTAKRDRPDGPPKPDFNARTAPGLPTQDLAAATKALADRQRAAKDDAGRAAAAGAGQGPAGEQRRKRDADFANRTARFAENAKAATDAAGITRSDAGNRTAAALAKATQEAGRAADESARAARESAAGRPDTARQARADAKAGLDAAANHLSEIGQSASGELPGADLGKAYGEMAKAADRFAGNNLAAAATAAKAAADALAPGGEPEPRNAPSVGGDKPSPKKGTKSDAVTDAMLPPELKQYSGVPWGNLPGDVKSKIVADLSARYGEDYARVIKLYFEQIADNK